MGYAPNYTPGLGFAPFMLKHLETATGQMAAPIMKVDHLGLLKMTQEAEPEVRLNNGPNLQQQIWKYKQRWTALDGQSTEECLTANNQPYNQYNLNLSNYFQIAIALDDTTVQQYEREASDTVNMGLPPTMFMNEVLEEVYAAANGVLSGVNEQLWALLVPNLGLNIRSGNSIDTINITKDITNLTLTDGMTQIMTDYQINNFTGTPNVVGSGLFNNYQNEIPYLGAGYNGLNTATQGKQANWFFDINATSLLGLNQIVVTEPGTVQRVDYLRYTGVYAGPRPGSSIFGTINLPVQMNGETHDIEFDYQLMYSPCATEFTSPYADVGGYSTFAIQRGWNIILSKYFGLATLPQNVYRTYDPQYGNRGTLRYTITNV